MTVRNIPPPRVSGIYSLRHKSGAEYIGGSGRCIANRISVHRWSLRQGRHGSPKLQELWNQSAEDDWEVVILERCGKEDVSKLEDKHLSVAPQLLNNKPTSSGKGARWSDEIKQKMREGRARYLQTPGAREKLSELARKQHEVGNFGQHTFTEESRIKQKESLARANATPAAREHRSQKAKAQHAAGKLGPATWKDGPAHVRSRTNLPAVSLSEQTGPSDPVQEP